jgi:hypothetical protein
MVLKKGNGYQGLQVVMGVMSGAEAWAAAVAQAAREGDWIAQERVVAPTVELPFLIDGRIVFAEVDQMSSPYLFGDALGGVICRNSIPGGSKVLAVQGGANLGTGLSTAFVTDPPRTDPRRS